MFLGHDSTLQPEFPVLKAKIFFNPALSPLRVGMGVGRRWEEGFLMLGHSYACIRAHVLVGAASVCN